MSYETKYYEIRGLKLAYHEWGSPDAPAVLFFHGFLDHGLSFDPVAQVLSKQFRVLAPDARGHGYSDWIGEGGYYHFADYFHDILHLVERLELENVHLIGHSMGGSIATGVASVLGKKIESVVMMEGMGPPSEPFDDLPDRLARWHKGLSKTNNALAREARKQARKIMPDLQTAADRLRSVNSRLTPERALTFARTFTEPVRHNGESGVSWRYDPLHRTIGSRPFRYEEAQSLWQSIEAPVLSLWGKESYFRPEKVARRHECLNNVKVALLEGAGHNIHHDRPELVSEVTFAWLNGSYEPKEQAGVIPCGFEVDQDED